MKIKIEPPGTIRRTKIGDAEVMDAQLVTYPKGKWFIQYLYKDWLDVLVRDMKRNVDSNFDNVLLCTGGEGCGKSSWMYWLFEKYSPGFDIGQSYTFDMNNLRERFRTGDYGNGLFWMDETSQMASNRKWQSEDNQDLVSILEVFRSKKFLFGGCIPSLDRADIYLREFRMRYQVICQPMSFPKFGYKERGYFEVKKRDLSGNMKSIGYGMYDPMPEEADKIYTEFKNKFQEKKMEEIANRGTKEGGRYKSMYEEQSKKLGDVMVHLHDQNLIDDSELMDMFGYTNPRSFDNALSKARKRLKEGI